MSRYRDPEWLRTEYVDKDRTLSDIADQLDVHTSTISKWKNRFNIEKSAQREQLECPVCGTNFVRYRYEVQRATYTNVCSQECIYAARKQGILNWMDSILRGDARDMSELPDQSVDLVITSPPYNVDVDYAAYDDDQSISAYRQFLIEAFEECHRVLRSDGGRLVVVIAGSGSGESHVPLNRVAMAAADEASFSLRRELIWDKSVSAGRSSIFGSYKSASAPAFHEQHESILVFYTDQYNRIDSGKDTISKNDFLTSTDSVWKISAANQAYDHPAPFPVELPRRAIELLSYKGDIVLDPFIGTGTTAVAASKTDRHYVGYDVSEDYCELARSRLRE